ncbi:NAD(P)/FAD-dependent oxidoreductase [Microbacterium sp. 179-B 1A2 NHS]|uniref:protoporphyrinogen/coproporphyrinogen oxidase n=1 Tax=Microbacterium sp. 179-B 1A2 NHS TaxID=3142383 RepID=UPI0039A15C54
MPSDAAADLVSHARSTRVVVIGGGIAGLVAALECAKVGMPVTLLEASGRLGGLASSAELDGRIVDTVADGFRAAPGALADLVDELGLAGDVVAARPADTWVAGPHGVAPLPRDSIFGIPANPFDDRTRRIIGWPGAWRAYLDRLRPPLTIGKTQSLAALVGARLGARVVDRMVAPLTYGIHGVAPEVVDVDSAVRGLNTALTRTGSLTGAVAQQLPDAEAPPSRATLRGGMSTLVTALVAKLADLDVDVRTNAPARALTRVGDGWSVSVDVDDVAPADGTGGAEPQPGEIAARAVIVATPEVPARRLLAPHLGGLDGAPFSPPDVDVVTLVLDTPALDAHPRGHAVYAAPGEAPALAVVHATATWPHDPAEPHIVRVTLPASREADAAVTASAIAAASTLLGVDLGTPLAAYRCRVPRALPASALMPARDDARTAVRRTSSLGVVGAWIGGNGLVRVVSDAAAESERVRSALLWGRGAEDALD